MTRIYVKLNSECNLFLILYHNILLINLIFKHYDNNFVKIYSLFSIVAYYCFGYFYIFIKLTK